jgi:SAM-dependent methyltransferase
VNSLKQKAWSLYRSAADRFPAIRKLLAPVRWYYHFNPLSYLFHRLRGVSYREWYAKRLDAFAYSIAPPPLTGLEREMGVFQLDYLKLHGLQPRHSVLDFGCGSLRAGVFIAQYLEPDRYTGADISQGRLDQGRQRLEHMELSAKKARLVRLKDVELADFSGQKFDYVWAQGVLAHMPLEDIDRLLKNVHKLMGPESVFFVNYADGAGSTYKTSLKDFYYNAAVIDGLCKQYGLKFERMSDWRHRWPHPLSDRDTLLKITLEPAGVEIA